jgi:GR25 family glycosyltransferase involved in LPS biosynthesis
MVDNNYERIIVFEDDARFESNFKRIFESLIDEMNRKEFKWDLLYFIL